jgi:hypothetical protein
MHTRTTRTAQVHLSLAPRPAEAARARAHIISGLRHARAVVETGRVRAKVHRGRAVQTGEAVLANARLLLKHRIDHAHAAVLTCEASARLNLVLAEFTRAARAAQTRVRVGQSHLTARDEACAAVEARHGQVEAWVDVELAVEAAVARGARACVCARLCV